MVPPFFRQLLFLQLYNGSAYFLEVIRVCARAWFHLFLDSCHSCSYKNMALVPPIFHKFLVCTKIWFHLFLGSCHSCSLTHLWIICGTMVCNYTAGSNCPEKLEPCHTKTNCINRWNHVTVFEYHAAKIGRSRQDSGATGEAFAKHWMQINQMGNSARIIAVEASFWNAMALQQQRPD